MLDEKSVKDIVERHCIKNSWSSANRTTENLIADIVREVDATVTQLCQRQLESAVARLRDLGCEQEKIAAALFDEIEV